MLVYISGIEFEFYGILNSSLRVESRSQDLILDITSS